MKKIENAYRVAPTLKILVLVAILAGLAYGQKTVRPNFTGVWILDLKKSDSLMAKLYKGRIKKGERFASRLEIYHEEPTLKLIETYIAEELDATKKAVGDRALGRVSTAYNTAGKGESNRLDGKNDWISTTVWKGDVISVDRPDFNSQIDRTILEFSLSKDGNELRITEKTVQKLPGVGFRQNELQSSSGRSVYVRLQPAVTTGK